MPSMEHNQLKQNDFLMVSTIAMTICRIGWFYRFVLFVLLFCSSAFSAYAETDFSILITSNLQGNFELEIENQEAADPLLRLGQHIVTEQQKGADLYLDMGNALYPGVLSKYSSGSIMMDFLDYFSCAAVLVSSKDLQIGTRNLEFLQKNKKVRLLSTNIVKGADPIFTPWFQVDKAGVKIAFLGLSSKNIRFDVAEKDLYGYSLAEQKEAIASLLNQITAAGIRHIVLLSGQTLKDTAAILEAYPAIGLALCGGDYTGRFYAGLASRLDLADGRSILMANDKVDYYLLRIKLGQAIAVQSLEPRKATAMRTADSRYTEFRNRLTLWKEKFHEDEQRLVASLSETETMLDDRRFTHLLRHRFDCELGMVEENTINPIPVGQDLRNSDFLSMVNKDYNIFVFSLSGDDLRTVLKKSEDLVIGGLDSGKDLSIQGYSLVGTRRYRVAASQPTMQRIMRWIGRKIAYRNTWLTTTDLLTDDLKNERVVLRNDYDYLDRRFRTTIDAYLANFFDNSSVDRGDNIETPPGQPAGSYTKWGLENRVDLTIYNKYHRFVITPYMLYSRQDDAYLNNILRGIFLYDYNLSETFKPYNKFQIDTVVETVDGLRPVLLRETMGVSAVYKVFSGKLGFGFEKEVRDPANAALYGIEFILGARIPLFSKFVYSFDLDTFSGIQNKEEGQRQLRSEINNAVTAAINSHLSMSIRHRYFYFYEDLTGESYENSQFITSLDVKNDWKFW